MQSVKSCGTSSSVVVDEDEDEEEEEEEEEDEDEDAEVEDSSNVCPQANARHDVTKRRRSILFTLVSIYAYII